MITEKTYRKICKNCLEVFETDKKGHIYCEDCSGCICSECGALFWGLNRTEKFCSLTCKQNAKLKKPKKKSTVIYASQIAWLKLRFDIFKRDNFQCVYCGRSSIEDKVELQVEHIKPVSAGGKNIIENYTTACRECNSGKGTNELSEDVILRIRQNRKDSNTDIL